jgi:hypothetical protein
MNSSLAWNNHVDIPNIPLKKWFHLVVMLKGKALDVYINGNLANRHKFTDIPKLNYGGFYVMLPKIVNTKTTTATCQDLEMESKKREAAASAAGKAANDALNSDSASLADKFSAGMNALSSSNEAGKKLTSMTSVTVTEKERDLGNIPLAVNGRMNGYVSRIKYFAFALSYSQIDKLVKEGPNKTMFRPGQTAPLSDSANVAVGYDVTNFSGPIYTPNSAAFDANLPGYQTDAWWTSGNQPSGAAETHQTGWGPQ